MARVKNMDCENLGECYICTLNDAPKSPCNCKNMFLHYECQKNIIMKKNNKCSVCLSEFNNVNVTIKNKKKISNATKIFIFLANLNMILFTVGIYEIIIYTVERKNKSTDVLDILLTMGITFIILSLILYILILKQIKYLIHTDNYYEYSELKIITLKV